LGKTIVKHEFTVTQSFLLIPRTMASHDQSNSCQRLNYSIRGKRFRKWFSKAWEQCQCCYDFCASTTFGAI